MLKEKYRNQDKCSMNMIYCKKKMLKIPKNLFICRLKFKKPKFLKKL